MTEPEPEFDEDVKSQQESVENALNELTDIRAYTLKTEELKAFKAAQYALRVISEDKDTVSSKQELERLFED